MSYTFDLLGFFHFGSALLAMGLGAFVVLSKKGTKLHVYTGYGYALAMLAVNISALMIYDLFGGFGPFHYMALISLLTLIGGLIPAYLKNPKNSWLDFHYEFMNWSVIGLYAAFWAETFSRFFRFSGFWTVVIIATITTVGAGFTVMKLKKKKDIEEVWLP